MAKKKGRWLKEREYNLTPNGKQRLEPQHTKIAQAGREVAEQCGGLHGKEFKLCRRKVMTEVFSNKEEPTPEQEV